MDNLFQLVSNVNTKMNDYVKQKLNENGYPNFHVSHGSILMNFRREEQLNYKEISKRINKSPQTMTTHIRKLEKDGFVTVIKDETDKRNKYVKITEKGKAFIPLMLDISKEMFIKQYKGVTKEEEVLLRGLLEKIGNNLGE